MLHTDFVSLMRSLSCFLMSSTKRMGGIKGIFDVQANDYVEILNLLL